MFNSLLVKLFGHSATLIHSDTLVLDRWLWLKRRLPITNDGEKLIDVGCGSGAFTIGASLRGYQATGFSWDERNSLVAQKRAKICGAHSTMFEVFDVRNLDKRSDLAGSIDVAICTENIEHIIDDFKLMRDIAICLKPGGRLLLTAPYYHFIAMTPTDNGPHSKYEDGGHVRRGYTEEMLKELCEYSKLRCEKITYCSGYFSQRITSLFRFLSKVHPLLGWAVILPLRVLPPLVDPILSRLTNWPNFSICLEAYKPRNGGF